MIWLNINQLKPFLYTPEIRNKKKTEQIHWIKKWPKIGTYFAKIYLTLDKNLNSLKILNQSTHAR